MEGKKLNVAIIYDSKYGNCENVAKQMGSILGAENEIQISSAKKIKQVDVLKNNPDLVIFGGPTHFGMIGWTIRHWINKFNKIAVQHNIELQQAAGFHTYFGDSDMKDKWISLFDKTDFSKQIYPEILALRVENIKGPLELDASEKIKEFILKLKDSF